MTVKTLGLLVFLTGNMFVNAQQPATLFEQANNLYRAEKYKEAILLYERIEASGKVSSELYHNLGNAYYKLNSVGPSIYNYEKALQLNPQNLDAENNLVFANRMALDAVEALPKTFFQNIEASVIQKLTFDQWAVMSIVFSMTACLFFLCFYFSYVPNKKRAYFVISFLSLLIFLLCISFTIRQYNTTISKVEAIIFDEKVSVKDAPLQSGAEVFEIHEGLKVLVLDEVDVWKKIKLADGKTGWVNAECLKVL